MSRTIRRKTRKITTTSWVLLDWDRSYYYDPTRTFHPLTSKEAKKAIARYRSDAGYGDNWYKSRSGWMRLVERKKYKRRCKEAVIRFLQGEEDCVLPTYKHDWLD